MSRSEKIRRSRKSTWERINSYVERCYSLSIIPSPLGERVKVRGSQINAI